MEKGNEAVAEDVVGLCSSFISIRAPQPFRHRRLHTEAENVLKPR